MSKRVLIVDDEKDIVDLVDYNLAKEGFKVLKAYDGEKALELARAGKPHLILLDLMLPGIQGLEVCKILRNKAETSSIPIIMLTAKGDEVDKVLGLEIGADDYVTKPFSIKELLARIRALLRRSEPVKGKAKIFEYGGLRIDFESHKVTVDGKSVNLSPMEYRLLKFLSQNPGRVYSREHLLDHVWGDEAFVEPRTVDVHIRRLRAQIEKNPEKPRYISTVRGAGYKFTERD